MCNMWKYPFYISTADAHVSVELSVWLLESNVEVWNVTLAILLLIVIINTNTYNYIILFSFTILFF